MQKCWIFWETGGKNLSQLQRAGSWQAEATQKSHSHCVLVSRIAWLTCANSVTKMASSGLFPSNVSLEPERSTVVSGCVTGQASQNGRPWGADSAGCVRGSAHAEWLSFGSGCKLKEHFSMADIMLNVHFSQDIGLICKSIQQIDFADRSIGSEIEEALFSINRCAIDGELGVCVWLSKLNTGFCLFTRLVKSQHRPGILSKLSCGMSWQPFQTDFLFQLRNHKDCFCVCVWI